ncbi:hypothetical protein L211DRAFT_342019 [Terfezia boudieri ATCC MYA-4762]|uniref:Uncharacterized protein n=1 Tax=Terfezia boudieri ATCC MYA-4762 TaxID=1051890 RepID=A0A3N4LHN2_9PEZI|nr:hypothetical protein L211DRAFT_342019 [Terfezia boudieri ATCC MYA-4762]
MPILLDKCKEPLSTVGSIFSCSKIVTCGKNNAVTQKDQAGKTLSAAEHIKSEREPNQLGDTMFMYQHSCCHAYYRNCRQIQILNMQKRFLYRAFYRHMIPLWCTSETLRVLDATC